MSNTLAKNKGSLPTDPLQALGVSLFLNITSYLPFPSLLAVEQVCKQWREVAKDRERTIWRAACHRTGVDKTQIDTLEMTERAMAQPVWYGEPGEEKEMPPNEAAGIAGWKDIYKKHVELDRNWRFGRCRERYLTPPGNSVWRIKVDPENQTLLATDRTGGITVTDCDTSKPLFQIRGVKPFAHLEFAKGFTVFDTGRDFALEVWRTQNAVDRSSDKKLNNKSDLCDTVHSHTHSSFNKTTQPLPKGHLAFYKKIDPPTPCIAFRARIDQENVEGKERALLATAGSQAVYIWDLEEGEIVETIRTDLTGDRIQYIEFDEEFVFICSHTRMHVFSRVTQKKLMTFPPSSESPWSLSLKFDLLNKVKSLPRQPVDVSGNPADPEYHENWMAFQEGVEDYPGVQEGSNGTTTLPGALRRPRDFSACHFTANDLYCTARSGHVVVVRDYKTAFAAPEEKRDEVVASHTILLDITTPAELLTTSKDRVVISTSNRVIILDPATLPSLPFTHPIKPVRFNVILSTCYDGVRMAACVQVDRSNIYHTYWALGENSLGGIKDPISGQRRLPPLRALNEFGMCVKVWNFAPWVYPTTVTTHCYCCAASR